MTIIVIDNQRISVNAPTVPSAKTLIDDCSNESVKVVAYSEECIALLSCAINLQRDRNQTSFKSRFILPLTYKSKQIGDPINLKTCIA